MPIARWAEDCGAECGVCPLGSRVPVPPELPVDRAAGKPGIYVVVGAPGSMDEIRKRILAGDEGMYLNDRITEFEKLYPPIKRSRLHLTPVALCRPKKHFKPGDWKEAIKSCEPRLINELKDIPEGSVIMAMGPKAVGALTGKFEVAPWRGYPLPAGKHYEFLNERGVTIMPMFEPRTILGAPAYTYVFRQDFFRAMVYHEEGFTPYQEVPVYIEENAEMEAYLKRVLETATVVGLDVETAGTNAFIDDLLKVGVGTPDAAASVPWPPQNSAIEDMLRVILKARHISKTLHNANHDLINLDSKGIEWDGVVLDTLIWHRIQYPLLKHDLGFIYSVEIGGPRWKTIYKKLSGGFNKRLFKKIADRHRPTLDQLGHYNGQDSNRQVILWNHAVERMKEAS